MELQTGEEPATVTPLDVKSECFCASSHHFLQTFPVSLSFLCLVSSSLGGKKLEFKSLRDMSMFLTVWTSVSSSLK